jgi:hypothetical protein
MESWWFAALAISEYGWLCTDSTASTAEVWWQLSVFLAWSDRTELSSCNTMYQVQGFMQGIYIA